MRDETVKDIVKKRYGEIALDTGCCGGNSCCSSGQGRSSMIGYSEDEINEFSSANLGLGCGNPTAFSNIREGDTVLDLGSGAGFDCFIAAKKVSDTGRVIGVDMTQEMIDKARKNASQYEYENVEFRHGDIEDLPIESNTVDVIISNCVINLAPDKSKVFKEAYRVLKNTGRMYVSDIVLLDELTEEQRNDEDLIAGCVGGALLKEKYLSTIKNIGFNIKILSENRGISKTQYNNLPVESLNLEISK